MAVAARCVERGRLAGFTDMALDGTCVAEVLAALVDQTERRLAGGRLDACACC